jgi:Uma2 family endonuclease
MVVDAVEALRIRTEEFDRMTDIGLFDGRHVELVEGTLYEMPAMGTPHLVALVRLQQMLTSFNAAGRLLVQVPIRVPDFDEPEPDLVVLRAPLGHTKPSAADCLVVIEVSDTTLDFDRTRKVPAYLRGGAPEVWILNLRDRQLEITRGGEVRAYRDGAILAIEGEAVDLGVILGD